MKKAFTIIGLFTLMLVVTSFTTPNEIGGSGGKSTTPGILSIGGSGGKSTTPGILSIGGSGGRSTNPS